MPINKVLAKKLCTKSEWTFVQKLLGDGIAGLKAGDLRRKLLLTRKYSSKFRDLEKKQKLAGKKTKTGGEGVAERTAQKRKIFDELALRLHARISKEKKLEAERLRKAELLKKALKAKASKAPGSKKKSRKRKALTPAFKGSASKNPFAQTAMRRIRTHQKSAQKRNQARRDSR